LLADAFTGARGTFAAGPGRARLASVCAHRFACAPRGVRGERHAMIWPTARLNAGDSCGRPMRHGARQTRLNDAAHAVFGRGIWMKRAARVSAALCGGLAAEACAFAAVEPLACAL